MVIAIIAILASLLLPALARAKEKANRADCVSKLKQGSLGPRLWASDNGDKFPWQVSLTNGGSMDSPVWLDHVRVASNQLGTPKILVCASDKARRPKENWALLDGTSDISFFVGTSSEDTKPQTIVLGDANVLGGGGGLDPNWNPFYGSSIDAAWDKTVHKGQGNIALADGSVQMVNTPGLREQIAMALSQGSSNVVFSLPRGEF